MEEKFYVHADFGGSDFSFVARFKDYSTVLDVIKDFSVRFGQRYGQDPDDVNKLVATVESKKLSLNDNVQVIPVKGDLVVKRKNGSEAQVEKLKQEGNACVTSGRFDEAIRLYTQAIALDKENAVLFLNRSLAYAKLEKWIEAEQDAAHGLVLDPTNVKAVYRRGQALCGQGKWDEAHEILSGGLDMDQITPAQATELGVLIGRCEEHGAGKGRISKEMALEAQTARLPAAAYVRLKPYFDAAYQAVQAQRWANAIKLYRSILEINPDDFTSLMGLAHCYLSNKSHKYKETIPILKRLCDKHGKGHFGCWRMLGEAYYGDKQYEEAIDAYATAAKFIGDEPKMQTIRTADLNIQVSKTFLAQGKLDFALHYVAQVLKVDESNVAALIQYGKVMLAQPNEEEAMKVALKVVVLQAKDRNVKRFVCSVLRIKDMPQRVIDALQYGGTRLEASTFSFLANIAKEYGAIDAADVFLSKAVETSTDPAVTLSLVHIKEVNMNAVEGLEVAKAWFAKNLSFTVTAPDGGSLSALQIMDAWKAGQPQLTAMREVASKGKPEWAMSADLDFLALVFTTVKMLYVLGQFDQVLAIAEQVEKFRPGWEFHLTTIRNEHAYYTCSVQALDVRRATLTIDKTLPRVYVIGDSHSLSCAWQTVDSKLLEPRLVTGCKMWHLRPGGDFFPKVNFERAIETIPDGSEVMFLLGEIDCREGLLICVEKGRYETLDEGIRVVINIFMDVLVKLQKRKHFAKVYIHPVVPVLDPTRHIVELFNPIFKEQVSRHSFMQWIDIYDKLVEPMQGPPPEACMSLFRLKPMYNLDGTHLNPTYVRLMDGLLRGKK